jgi:hypothetical protein
MTADRVGMISRRWKRRYARLVRDISVRTPGDSESLCRAVAEHLDHPIQLLALPLPAQAPCGLLLSTSKAHYVVYDNTTGAMHQRHIVAHELGHLLAGHGAQLTLDADVARLLMPSLDPTMVRTVLARVPGYGARAEREAEIIADLLWRQTNAEPAESTWPVAPAAANLVDRIRQSLAGD